MLSAALALALLATASARSLQHPQRRPYIQDFDDLQYDREDLSEHAFESVHPVQLARARRQLGSMSTNPDGTANVNLKIPIARGESNVLSAVGSVAAAKPGGGYGAASGGLALDNINGHGLSLTDKHIPGFGQQLTAAGRVGLVNTPDHRLTANAFVTRNMPSIPNVPNFNTKGAGLDYMFRDKVGASFNTAHTDLLQKTDYSAMGNLNLFKDRSSSLDLNAGFTKSQSPFSSFNHNWQPSGGLSYTRYW